MDVVCVFGLIGGRRVNVNHLPNNRGSLGLVGPYRNRCEIMEPLILVGS